MLFSKTSLGIEINPSGVAFALLSGRSVSPRLERVAYVPLAPGTLRVSLREPNIMDPQAFTERLRSAHNLLLTRTTRLSVSLPDTVGRVMIIDVEGRFKSRAEALDVIRWKLKKSIPFDLADTHLDYQQVQLRENGDMALLVALVSRTVVSQYEEVLCAAGFTPARIDFNQFNLYRTFEQRLALQENMVLVSFYGDTLGVMVIHDGTPAYVRIKDLTGSHATDSRVFMEINSSLLVYRERFPERELQNIYCLAAPDMMREFCGMVAEASGIDPIVLEAKAAVRPADDAPGDQESLFPFTAAIGAALRSL